MESSESTAANSDASSLTWQQQLLSQSQGPSPETRRKRTEKKSKRGQSDKTTMNESSQTWQQKLLQQSKRPGPAFDHAADQRDVETFGATGAPNREQTGTPDRRKPKSREKVKVKNPETPSKPGRVAPAYAAPTFHNSPAPTSLPPPRFSSRSKLSESVSAPTTPSSDAIVTDRDVPATPALPPAQGTTSPSVQNNSQDSLSVSTKMQTVSPIHHRAVSPATSMASAVPPTVPMTSPPVASGPMPVTSPTTTPGNVNMASPSGYFGYGYGHMQPMPPTSYPSASVPMPSPTHYTAPTSPGAPIYSHAALRMSHAMYAHCAPIPNSTVHTFRGPGVHVHPPNTARTQPMPPALELPKLPSAPSKALTETPGAQTVDTLLAQIMNTASVRTK